MNQMFLPTILLVINPVAVALSCAQPPDSLTVREAINGKCLATQGTKDQVETVEELEIPAGDRKLNARLYRPMEAGPLPVLVFFHGGGFVAGNLDTHDNACRYLCKRTPCLVLAVEYRLAPRVSQRTRIGNSAWGIWVPGGRQRHLSPRRPSSLRSALSGQRSARRNHDDSGRPAERF